MNEYKVLFINCGMAQVLYVVASDIIQATYNAAQPMSDIVSVTLVGSQNVTRDDRQLFDPDYTS